MSATPRGSAARDSGDAAGLETDDERLAAPDHGVSGLRGGLPADGRRQARPLLRAAEGRLDENQLFERESRAQRDLAHDHPHADGLRRADRRADASGLGRRGLRQGLSRGDAVARAATAARAEGVEEGRKAGVEAERARVKAILGCDEAKGREPSAQHLALSTGMSLEGAQVVLAGLAVAAPAAPDRIAAVPRPALRPTPPL